MCVCVCVCVCVSLGALFNLMIEFEQYKVWFCTHIHKQSHLSGENGALYASSVAHATNSNQFFIHFYVQTMVVSGIQLKVLAPCKERTICMELYS